MLVTEGAASEGQIANWQVPVLQRSVVPHLMQINCSTREVQAWLFPGTTQAA